MSKGPRKPAPPQTAAQRQRELARILVRMDEMVKSVGDLAIRARARPSVGGLTRYRRFAKRVRDFFALAAVAEEKLYNMPELSGSPMATALDRMHARMVVLFVEGSWGFFDIYRRVSELPLGAHEICGVELRGMGEICKFLDDERYDGERGQALRRQAERVTDLMHEIMDRVPPLEDFGDLPSISPKGLSRQPIKTPSKRRAEPPPPPPPPEAAWTPPEAAWEPAPASPWSEATEARVSEAPEARVSEAPEARVSEAPEARWETPVPPAETPATYETAGAAGPMEAEYDDSAYLDDVPDEPEEEPAAPARPAPQPSSRPSPSPLVRELTLDMVEAEERRAALAQRMAAAKTPPPSPATPSPAAPAAAPPPPSSAAIRPAAAPFRAPPSVRPIKRP